MHHRDAINTEGFVMYSTITFPTMILST